MNIVVQKFGGTSVADPIRIKRVANIIAEAYQSNEIIVVLSAMAGVTDQLVSYTRDIAKLYDVKQLPEYDTVIAAGEQVSIGLLALALMELGIKSRSYLGWQIPIYTNGEYSHAKITAINTAPIFSSLENKEIPIIAGFQGVFNNRIVTLGRGGSDTTAASIAAAVSANRCDIYTDVDGVFTADPRIVTKARKLNKITYEEMLEIASSGAKVLHPRAAEVAIRYNLKLRVLSTFNSQGGTIIVKEVEYMEIESVTGITSDSNLISITLCNINSELNTLALIIKDLSSAGISVDIMMNNSNSNNNSYGLTLLVNKEQESLAFNVLSSIKGKYYDEIIIDHNIVKISVIGIGIKNNLQVLYKVFEILSSKGIRVICFTSSEIKISLLIKSEYKELAVRSLHSSFGLDYI